MGCVTGERTGPPNLAGKGTRTGLTSNAGRKSFTKGSKLDSRAFLTNARLARSLWGPLSIFVTKHLRMLTDGYALSLAAGDLILLEGRWYITHAGLLRFAQRKRCFGINTALQRDLSDRSLSRWVFRATVYKSSVCRGFVGYGDADPSNCSLLVHGAEMRVAETRAVNRALRKAYGLGLCSVEELAVFSGSEDPVTDRHKISSSQAKNCATEGEPRLRDRLCLLIRQHNLNPTLVKAYAADFCGTATVSSASRELVESFISHLSTAAKENRDGLVCKLNSYAQSEAHP